MSATQAIPATTNEGTQAPARIGRSIGAVLGGFVTVFVITTLVDIALHAAGIFPPMDAPPMSDALFALAFSYRVVFNTCGGAITARLAPRRPMAHALALGTLGTAVGTLGAVVMWDAGPGWYSLANVAIGLPATWLGARLAGAR